MIPLETPMPQSWGFMVITGEKWPKMIYQCSHLSGHTVKGTAEQEGCLVGSCSPGGREEPSEAVRNLQTISRRT